MLNFSILEVIMLIFNAVIRRDLTILFMVNFNVNKIVLEMSYLYNFYISNKSINFHNRAAFTFKFFIYISDKFIYLLYIYTRNINPLSLFLFFLAIKYFFSNIIATYIGLLFFFISVLIILIYLYICYMKSNLYSNNFLIKYLLLTLILLNLLVIIILIVKLGNFFFNYCYYYYYNEGSYSTSGPNNSGPNNSGPSNPGPNNPGPNNFTLSVAEENERRRRRNEELDRTIASHEGRDEPEKRLEDMDIIERNNKILKTGSEQKDRILSRQLNSNSWVKKPFYNSTLKGKRKWTSNIDFSVNKGKSTYSNSSVLENIIKEKNAYNMQEKKFQNIINNINANNMENEWFPKESKPLFTEYIELIKILKDNLKSFQENISRK